MRSDIVKRLVCFVLFVLFCLLTQTVMAGKDVFKQKGELKQIESEVKESRNRLDSLQKVEKRLLRNIANQDQRMSSDRKLINRLSRELRQLRGNMSAATDILQDRQLQEELARRRYLGNLRQFYKLSRRVEPLFYADPNSELQLHKQVTYLKALANFESRSVSRAGELLHQSIDKLDGLRGEATIVSKMKRDRETNVTLVESRMISEEKKLGKIRNQSTEEADRIVMLIKAAEDMAAIIARLEEQRERERRASRGEAEASIFLTLKGQLRSPISGKIALTYGIHVDPVTGLESFSPGITIKGKAGGKVFAVASGRIAFAGQLRGYGNFVIIQHDNQYYTTYARLASFSVSLDENIQARVAIGLAGSDGLIKFELRKGRETLDPVTWLNIESL